ncbi:hypothetical protein FZ934_12760 [Rhizobium grahamii]|uniref:Lipoprotein n=1 Tax=Rhizobium grahamii TaxID=1120045 RepID=A0A5Q0C6Y7_9HYPH|nr:hypothetical protein FZ934_12760 [Rhizobium grahamii]QRM49654.1 hypothetical protein F3Y33_10130 [Rhizobium sp. BG6]
MGRIHTFVAAGIVIILAAFTSACTTGPSHNPADNYYNPRTSENPACDGGFRPTNNWTCSY